MEKGDQLMGRFECAAALEKYEEAKRVGPQDTATGEWEAKIGWRLHQALKCIGRAKLYISGPTSKSCQDEVRCGVQEHLCICVFCG